MRAVAMAVVPLTPPEVDDLLSGVPVSSQVRDLPLLRLVAQGLAVNQIARRLHVSSRTVYRRVARLKAQFGVATVHDLAMELARRGF